MSRGRLPASIRGGLQKYQRLDQGAQNLMNADPTLTYDYSEPVPPEPDMEHHALSPIQESVPDQYPQPDAGDLVDPRLQKTANNHIE